MNAEQERSPWYTSAVPALVVLLGAVTGLVVGFALGAAPGAMLIGGAVLVGAILALWSSVRLLLGESLSGVDVSDEAEERVAGDPLFEKKRAALAALADMERERELGKIDASDYEDVVGPLRAQAKAILKELDERVAPHRPKAEKLLAEFLAREGIVAAPKAAPGATAAGSSADAPNAATTASSADAHDEAPAHDEATSHGPADSGARPAPGPACSSCGVANDDDARFCKGCGQPLDAAEKSHAS